MIVKYAKKQTNNEVQDLRFSLLCSWR